MGILICGLNGVGKSTLGRALAARLSYRFIDNEDLYFPGADARYAYAAPRGKDEVVRLLEAELGERRDFVFAAVKGDYGEKLLSLLDCAVLLEVPREVRLKRVYRRSYEKFGARILPGGDLEERESAWFAQVERRPEDTVRKWLETVGCPVIRADGTRPVEENVEYLASVLA